ncbi:hypothetical protein DQ04_00361140 [Trypanosoma grayi]|uniref:hypothetical protein n=1 Tax=Trypanosoma grayi TaxID=71804 RepID=UPI0004F49D9F|nr:hypothetical protein DQ04_00361140 [Trypanosoma grayi]KEG14652.1 hypothetical protein DQ04_00361140 [Trypanosoma grayi]
MQYSICVAADCDGEKVNLRFLFDSYGPSVTQLLNRATIAFNNLFHHRSIPRAFAASAAVVFNDLHSTWDRLERSTQLLHNSQVYLFQPDIIDLPAEIPEPFESQPLLGDYVSPRRDASDSPRANGPAHYAPRPAFTHASPSPLPSCSDNRKKQTDMRGASGDSGRGRYGVHSYDIRSESLNGDARQSAQFATPQRFDREAGLAISERTPIQKLMTSASPPIRQPAEESYRSSSSGDARKSIIRDEREKIELQWRLPLDEMRRSLKEETRQMERSISPMRKEVV